jgi:hypothetical protein
MTDEYKYVDAKGCCYKSPCERPGEGPCERPARRIETTSENIARDMREGRFPQRSEPQMIPAAPLEKSAESDEDQSAESLGKE